VRNIIKSGVVEPCRDTACRALTMESIIPENTDLRNTIVELIFSNSRLAGIEKILKSLIEYPY
jgi:hypothetical protein